MKLVAFDTSTEACSVAVQIDGEVRCDHRIVQREHANLLLTMVQGLLDQFSVKPIELDGVVFGQGPGSFTGVRIAAAAAQGLALAAGCGVQGVSSLQAMARACFRERGTPADNSEWIIAALDARMDQIYINCYAAQAGVFELGDEAVVNADDYRLPIPQKDPKKGSRHQEQSATHSVNKLVLCGSGAERYESTLTSRLTESGDVKVSTQAGVFPHAQDLLDLVDTKPNALWVPPSDAQPVYLRNKVALTLAERSSA